MTERKDAKESIRWPRIIAAATAVGIAAAILFVVYGYLQPAASEYRRFTSPDERYAVVVYRKPSRFPLMPGQGGDAKGFVRLVDREGRILQEKRVAIVNTIDLVEWEPGFVSIRLFAEWPLPPPPSPSH